MADEHIIELARESVSLSYQAGWLAGFAHGRGLEPEDELRPEDDGALGRALEGYLERTVDASA